VLIGSTGPNNNVLKIRPPIIFNQEHSEILLAALVKALDECGDLFRENSIRNNS